MNTPHMTHDFNKLKYIAMDLCDLAVRAKLASTVHVYNSVQSGACADPETNFGEVWLQVTERDLAVLDTKGGEQSLSAALWPRLMAELNPSAIGMLAA